MHSLVDMEFAHDIRGNGIVNKFGDVVAWFGEDEDGTLHITIRASENPTPYVLVEALPREHFV